MHAFLRKIKVGTFYGNVTLAIPPSIGGMLRMRHDRARAGLALRAVFAQEDSARDVLLFRR